MRLSISFFAWILCILSSFLIPFVHFGVNEYLSSAFIFFALVFLFSIFNFRFIPGRVYFIFLILIMLLLIRYFLHMNAHSTFVALRELAVVFCLILFSMVKYSKEIIFSGRLIYLPVMIILFVSFVQMLDYKFLGVGYFQLSESWFSLDYGTIASSFLKQSGDVTRPAAFFSEPSALGAFGLSVFFIGSINNNKNLLFSGLALVVFSFSLSAFAGVIIVGALFASRGGAWVIFLIGAIGSFLLYDRLGILISGDDQSALLRVYYPYRLLIENFAFFGIPENELYSLIYYSGAGGNIFDNYVFGSLIIYGAYAIVLFSALAYFFSPQFLAFIIVFFFINGSPFYYDRIMYYILVVSYCNSSILSNFIINKRNAN